jgi:hypothetical protein
MDAVNNNLLSPLLTYTASLENSWGQQLLAGHNRQTGDDGHHPSVCVCAHGFVQLLPDIDLLKKSVAFQKQQQQQQPGPSLARNYFS